MKPTAKGTRLSNNVLGLDKSSPTQTRENNRFMALLLRGGII